MKKIKTQDQINENCESLKNFYRISHQILLFASKKISSDFFIKESLKMIQEYMGYDIYELWLKDIKNQYYAKYNTINKPKFIMEIMSKKNKFDFKSKYKNNKIIAICNKILNNEFDHQDNNFTEKGSYFNNDENLQIGKNKAQSFAIITINKIFKTDGILVVHCLKKDLFNSKKIELLENITQSLGIAFNHLHTQINLNERVKELTCLFGIARVGDKTDLSLDKILQQIVNLLPPALQYPKVATARIVLDGKYYTSPNFNVNSRKQSSNILLNGVKRGFVEVAYPKKALNFDESPFLIEERHLIDVVAREIAIIVERRIAENEKEKLENQLRHADRLATIGQLSAGVAHELNEPLANILGFAQLLQKNDNLTKQEKNDLDGIVSASLHAREIIKKLMLFSRQMPPQKTKVNLNQLIENGLYFLMSRCEKNGIEVTRLFSDNIKDIIADSSQLYQVLVNLVVNAIQAMPNGGKLTIETIASNEHVSFIVKDTGIGMSDEILRQIFIPFFTTKDITEGTGLGLPVVHGIVSSHGGSIKVESKVNAGSKFEVVLPVKS